MVKPRRISNRSVGWLLLGGLAVLLVASTVDELVLTPREIRATELFRSRVSADLRDIIVSPDDPRSVVTAQARIDDPGLVTAIASAVAAAPEIRVSHVNDRWRVRAVFTTSTERCHTLVAGIKDGDLLIYIDGGRTLLLRGVGSKFKSAMKAAQMI
jgi:hypothetical protein